ncbi:MULTISPECIES: Ig-like domain-containing protein, partial [unclassified Acinetobacter]|uniref:Ig-like domain-containing protein n=1 Tax=unclassified Acinetobacter TaxID=196816 RepID=UPI0025762C67
MENISIVSKDTGNLSLVTSSSFSVQAPSVVVLKYSKEQIKNMMREGDHLIITLDTGEVIQIENFFTLDNSLVLENNNELLWVQFNDLNNVSLETINYAGLDNVEPLLYDSVEGTLPFIAGIAGAIGTVAYIANTDISHNSGKDITAPNAPSDVVISADGTTVTGKAEPGSTVEIKDKEGNLLGSGTADANGDFTVGLDNPLTNGETVDVTAKDEAGNVSDKTEVTAADSTAPDAPSDVVISADGTTVTGKAEPGSTVEIKDKEGNLLGSGTADANGDFTVGLDNPLTNGETVDVTAKDEAGNVSDKTEVTAADSTAPDAPSDVVISADGTTVTGKAEAGATVEIKDKEGNLLGSGTADANGNFTVGLDNPLTNGETVDVTAKDEAGNVSDKTEVTAPIISTSEKDDIVGDIHLIGAGEDGIFNADELGTDGKVDVVIQLGKDAQVGDVIRINGKEHTITQAEKDVGQLKTEVVVQEGNNQVVVEATDKNGNIDQEIKDFIVDTIPADIVGAIIYPSDSYDELISTHTIKVHIELGKDAEVGQVVTVNNTNHVLTQSDLDQGYVVAKVHVVNGDNLIAVEAKDHEGNLDKTSDTVNIQIIETGGEMSNIIDDAFFPEAGVDNIFNKAEFGTDGTAKLEIILGADTQVGDVINAGGVKHTITQEDLDNKKIQLEVPLDEGDNFVFIFALGHFGTFDQSNVHVFVDTVAPAIPSDVVISADGTTVTGKAEAGSTVEIKDKEGNLLGSGTADANGNFTV